MKRSVASFFIRRSCMDSKKPNAPQAGLRPSEQQAFFLVPIEGSDCSLARSAPVLQAGVEAEGRSVGLLALTGQAGPPSVLLPGHDLQLCDGILFQPLLPATWGCMLCCLLSCSVGCLCLCRERTQMLRHALLVLSAHHKCSRGARYDNGKHLDMGRVLTPMYNCARIKLTAPQDGCKLWSMRVIISPGGSHDQEQDSEYDTRIVSTREVHSRHCHHVRVGQEYGAQVSASSGTVEHAPSAAQSSLEPGSLQRADQAVDQRGSLLQLRGDVATSAGDGLHGELERAQSLCPSLASPVRWALSGGAL